MEAYLFVGTVLPERAQLSLNISLRFSHLHSGKQATAKVSIINNQIAVTVEAEDKWELFTLRNTAKNIVRGELALLGYVHGYAYNFDISRAINSSLGIDYVFGIDIPDLAPKSFSDINERISELRVQFTGPAGIYVRRCFNDLVSAVDNPDDTGFYCYRAIECLRHHCATIHDLADAERLVQWAKFQEISGYGKAQIAPLLDISTPLRHGDVQRLGEMERSHLLRLTWEIVGKYLGDPTGISSR